MRRLPLMRGIGRATLAVMRAAEVSANRHAIESRKGSKTMHRKVLLLIVAAGMTLVFSSSGWADVPAPPVNQVIGMDDVAISNMLEADCRVCHSSGVPDRHHLLYGQTIPSGSLVPYLDADGDGNNDTIYGCLNCHDQNFTVVRDCTQCHTSSPHHSTPEAQALHCQTCHGSVIDNIGDGHYIPTYTPSFVTPSRSGGAGLPLNSRGENAGGCIYCHDDDGLNPKVILDMEDLHHAVRGPANMSCSNCHSDPRVDTQIRVCEGCHGPDSLHNIQADSPKAPTGTVVVGGEDAGYGHVGRDAGPNDSDCWGCHGFPLALAPSSGPIAPTIYRSDRATIKAGTDTVVVLSGSAFTNTAAGAVFESDVLLTAADGSSLTLTPDLVDEGLLAVTIPGDTPSGNYDLQAVKADEASNPVVVSIVAEVIIADATFDGTVTINGSGFGGYAEGSGTSVTGTITTGRGKKRSTTTAVEATIVFWSDTKIEADFDSIPTEVTVNSVFGSDTSEVGGGKPGKGQDRKSVV